MPLQAKRNSPFTYPYKHKSFIPGAIKLRCYPSGETRQHPAALPQPSFIASLALVVRPPSRPHPAPGAAFWSTPPHDFRALWRPTMQVPMRGARRTHCVHGHKCPRCIEPRRAPSDRDNIARGISQHTFAQRVCEYHTCTPWSRRASAPRSSFHTRPCAATAMKAQARHTCVPFVIAERVLASQAATPPA